MKILYIASKAPEAEALAIEREIMDLQQNVAEANFDTVQTVFLPDVTLEALPLALSRHRPDILHIAVHGNVAGLWFAREPFGGETDRQLAQVSGEALADLLDPLNLPKLVFLNACESHEVAQILASRGMMAIGTSAPIVDQTAVAVSRLMYERILGGLPVSDVYRAMNAFVSSHQADGINLRLAVPAGISAETSLYSKPTIIARLSPATPLVSGKPVQTFIGVGDAPSDTIQIVFFTADESYIDHTRPYELEELLTEVKRGGPRRGEMWTNTSWNSLGNVRIAACGISASGKTFSISSMLVPALERYAKLNPTSDAYKAALRQAREILLLNESDGNLATWPKD